MLNKKSRQILDLHWFFAFILAWLFSIFDIKSFAIWPQVSELWDSDVSPFLLVGHPHFFRFLITYPGFLLENYYPGFGFGFYYAIFFSINYIYFRRIFILNFGRIPSLFSWIVFFSAHLFMNGRGVIAWSAWLICISVCFELGRGYSNVKFLIGKILIGCFFATVSTGVFVVVVLSFCVFIFSKFKFKIFDSKNIFYMPILMPLFFLILDYFLISIQKNLDFYGGGFGSIVGMLGHGLGSFFTEIGYLKMIILFFLFPVVVVFGFIFFCRGWRTSLDKLVLVSFAGGSFGFTTLTLIIPIVLMGIELWIVNVNKNISDF